MGFPLSALHQQDYQNIKLFVFLFGLKFLQGKRDCTVCLLTTLDQLGAAYCSVADETHRLISKAPQAFSDSLQGILAPPKWEFGRVNAKSRDCGMELELMKLTGLFQPWLSCFLFREPGGSHPFSAPRQSILLSPIMTECCCPCSVS